MRNHWSFKDLAGQQFGRLKVLKVAADRKRWICECSCGKRKEVNGYCLRKGISRSCGCLQKERARAAQLKHGDTNHNGAISREYVCWRSMRSRCSNRNNKSWDRYGGRGIKVCERWEKSFENFLADMGRKPSPEHSIERMENSSNYEPGNCKWATRSEQMKNRRPCQPRDRDTLGRYM